ncbi:hypothetical protein MSEDJ_03340 [Mycolicibacterium sediminis]|uniref:Uncharacterized protein n=1 Tax=Mycolicibacterium sediminis TaxID=1286180 RepID=A0A7I7QIX1_9MYCO|nr:hypothetical protein MSEDJ_03340 [Mycolicibacterium sediminis]
MRLFVADQTGDDVDDLSELTSGGGPVVRLSAPDLQRAMRRTAMIHADAHDVAVILDLAVVVPGDYRVGTSGETVHYAGTVAGLTGLIADIDSAGVADGVALIPGTAVDADDLRKLGRDVLRLLADRDRKSA